MAQERDKRAAAVRHWAEQRGLEYLTEDRGLPDQWAHAPFQIGSARVCSDVVSGDWDGLPALAFSYSYRTRSGESTKTHTFTVIRLALPGALPTVTLTPQWTATNPFRGMDLQVESPEFNDRWVVKSDSPRAAHELLHPRLLERLVGDDLTQGRIWIQGRELMLVIDGEQDVAHYALWLNALSAVARLVSRYLWLDGGADPTAVDAWREQRE